MILHQLRHRNPALVACQCRSTATTVAFELDWMDARRAVDDLQALPFQQVFKATRKPPGCLTGVCLFRIRYTSVLSKHSVNAHGAFDPALKHV